MADQTTREQKVWTTNRLKTLEALRGLGAKYKDKRLQILRAHRDLLKEQGHALVDRLNLAPERSTGKPPPAEEVESPGELMKNARPGTRAIRASLPVIVTKDARQKLLEFQAKGTAKLRLAGALGSAKEIAFLDERGIRRVGTPYKYLPPSKRISKRTLLFGIELAVDENGELKARTFYPTTPTKLEAPSPKHLTQVERTLVPRGALNSNVAE